MNNLPIGIQSFENIRARNGIYVDKTEYIYKLISETSSYFFLSRPRRFGKSLLLSKLSNLFRGNKQLFEGTWIYDKISFEPHPVLHFDMSVLDYKDQSLQTALTFELNQKAEDWGITLKGKSPKTMFKELIIQLSKQNKVIVLIDEYDKPIHDYLDNLKQAEANRKALANFYGVIKGVDAHLRFCIFTGVSRFSRMSIFSELNHLRDITLDSDYAGMLGYTHPELLHYFSDYLNEVAKKYNSTLEKILPHVKEWYNGCSWDGKIFVYNPFSMLMFLANKVFYNYWFETGIPTFLTKLLHQNFKYNLEPFEVQQFSLASTSISQIDETSLLFQTGYLTIKQIRRDGLRQVYQLAYPNTEVKDAFLQYMFMEFNHNQQLSGVMTKIDRLINALENHEIEDFVEVFNTIFASIPYQIFIANQEAYYHSVVYLTLQLVGIQIVAEVSQAKGRADAIIHLKNSIYILEFKLNQNAQIALQQIKDNGYANPYLQQGKEVRLLGLNMTANKKAFTDFVSEVA